MQTDVKERDTLRKACQNNLARKKYEMYFKKRKCYKQKKHNKTKLKLFQSASI